MAKITVSMGMNVPLYKDSKYDRFTPSVMISEIDTNGDVEEQVDQALTDAKIVWSKIGDWLEKQVNFELEGGVELPIDKK